LPLKPFARSHFLLYKAHWRSRAAAFGSLLDRPELRFIAGKIFAQCAPDALSVAGTNDDAAQELSLRPIRKNVDEVQGELFHVVMNHHQVAVEALQLFFVGLDL